MFSATRRPNKSVQPTTGSVTPRAIEGVIECQSRNPNSKAARVAPAPVVADLQRWAEGQGAVDGLSRNGILQTMKGEFTAIIEESPEGGYWAICPEVPGANGQGETVEEAKTSLREAIRLIFEDRIEDAKRGLPEDAIQTVVAV